MRLLAILIVLLCFSCNKKSDLPVFNPDRAYARAHVLVKSDAENYVYFNAYFQKGSFFACEDNKFLQDMVLARVNMYSNDYDCYAIVHQSCINAFQIGKHSKEYQDCLKYKKIILK